MPTLIFSVTTRDAQNRNCRQLDRSAGVSVGRDESSAIGHSTNIGRHDHLSKGEHQCQPVNTQKYSKLFETHDSRTTCLHKRVNPVAKVSECLSAT